MNSVSTLLNKGGITCNCPRASQDFCVNQNKQASAQLLCSSLGLEARVGETAARLKSTLTQSNTHLFRDVARTSQVSYAHHGQLKTCQTCQSHHAKVHADVCSGKNTYQSQKTDRGQTKRKHIFTLPGTTTSEWNSVEHFWNYFDLEQRCCSPRKAEHCKDHVKGADGGTPASRTNVRFLHSGSI